MFQKAPSLPPDPKGRVLPNIFVGFGTVVAKERYREFCRLTIRCPEVAGKALPGQFVNLYLDATGDTQSPGGFGFPTATLLPRPFSIAQIVPLREQQGPPQAFSVLFDLRSVGTRWLAGLHVDAPVRLMGPLGKGFWLPEGTSQAVLVGGGIGAAPFPFLAESLRATGVKVIVLVGALNAQKLPFDPVRAEYPLKSKRGHPLSRWAADEFERKGIPSALALETPQEGFFTGTVIDLLKEWLETPTSRERIILYGCGPKGMMKALAGVAESYGFPCQVATEERMGCGVGICFGCPVPMRDGNYKLCCVDGPVFEAAEIAWS